MIPISEVPGAVEVLTARRFFIALARRDVLLLGELLSDAPLFENMDGPVFVDGREQLARSLAARSDDVEYQLVDVAGTPGEARARFILVVEGVPGGIVLEAVLRFIDQRIAAIRVGVPTAATN